LLAQGEKLLLDEVVSPPASADDPAYREFLAAVRRLQGRAIQPGSLSFTEYVAPGELKPLDLMTNLEASGSAGVAWTRWQTNVVASRPFLEALRQALRSPPPRSDIDYRVLPMRGSDFVLRREAAHWLAGGTFAALHATNRAAAVESLKALLALTELHRDDPTLVNQMIRVAISSVAFEVTCHALQLPGWSEAQLAELQSAWACVRLFDRMVTALKGERAWILVWFEQARTNSLAQVRNQVMAAGPRPVNVETILEDYVLDPLYCHTWAEQDQLFFLRTYQSVLEAVRLAQRHKSWSILGPEIDRVFQSIERTRGLDRFRRRFSLMAVPNWKRAMETTMRAETQRSLCLAALAIRRYELQHGQLPADLAALTPELLDPAPVDYMDGRTLRYRVEADGIWRLWSVGSDGKDDGGEALPAQRWGNYQNLWDGRDAVWPRLASEASLLPVIPSGEVCPLIQFDNAPLRAAIVALARQLELNLIFDPSTEPELSRPVTLRLENVSVGNVLEVVLDRHQLRAVRHPTQNVIGITRK
jgi:type II secretory pathway pseudopilin PulG